MKQGTGSFVADFLIDMMSKEGIVTFEICRDCGLLHGLRDPGDVTNWHGICDICHKAGPVTNSSAFGLYRHDRPINPKN